MKNLLFILLCFVFFGCKETNIEKKELNYYYGGSEINVLTIEGCEYLIIGNDSRSVTHKGNCNNPIHKQK